MTTRPGLEKDIEIGGTTYKIKKFTPEVGCYWAMRLFGDLISGLGGKAKLTSTQITKLITRFTQMERAQFEQFQKDCLAFVWVKFESGFHPLVNSEGFITQPDLPAPTVFALTLHSFMHSMSDFLDQSLLGSLLGAASESDILETPKTT